MLKKGKLSLVEKTAIKQWLSEDRTVDEMATDMNRSPQVIEKYITGELDQLITDVAKIRAERYAKANEKDIAKVFEDDEESVLSSDLLKTVYKRLLQSGLTEKDSIKVIEKAMETETGKNTEDPDELYTICINCMRAGDFMIKKTKGGSKGVAIMSPAASQRTDGPSKANNPSDKIRNNIADTGRMNG